MRRPPAGVVRDRIAADLVISHQAGQAGRLDDAWQALEEAHVLSQPWAWPNFAYTRRCCPRLAGPGLPGGPRSAPAATRCRTGQRHRPIPSREHRPGVSTRDPAHADPAELAELLRPSS